MQTLTSILPQIFSPSAQSSSSSFLSACIQSFTLIFGSEFGDRTFFLAALLAMKWSRLMVWAGTLSAATLTTILTAVLGKAFPMFLDKKWTTAAAAALFFFFGVQNIREWYKLRHEDDSENEELEEAEEQLKEAGSPKKTSCIRVGGAILISPAFVQAFTMTGMAEFGDQSHLTTIALSAAKEMYGVIVGGIFGHALCAGVAVVGGRLMADKISERAVALMGGISFLIFSVVTAFSVVE